jgi:hypothetical protein
LCACRDGWFITDTIIAAAFGAFPSHPHHAAVVPPLLSQSGLPARSLGPLFFINPWAGEWDEE